jgi:hypothetical protein
MSHQYQEMYQDYIPNRSPGRQGGNYSSTINRQPSRHFDGYPGGVPGPLGLYTAEDHAARYDSTPQFDRMQPPTMGGGYTTSASAYNNQTWNYGGANGAAHTMSGTGRMKTPSRRAGLPTVSNSIHHD